MKNQASYMNKETSVSDTTNLFKISQNETEKMQKNKKKDEKEEGMRSLTECQSQKENAAILVGVQRKMASFSWLACLLR